jgi:hypothetical protein
MTGSGGVEALRFHLHAAQAGHQALVGKEFEGTLARDLRYEGYSVKRFGRALMVRREPRYAGGSDWTYIGMIYLTGLADVLDEASEKEQLRYAGWRVTEFPHALVNVSGISERPEHETLIRALKDMWMRS